MGIPGPRAKSPVSYVRSSLIFVKSNSRGANKSSVAAAERRSFVSSFSSPLSDSLRSPLFVSTTDHGYGLFSENHRSARFSNSIPRFNFDLKEKKLDRQIRETRIPSVRSLFSRATTREWLARQTDLPPCHSLLCHLFFARFALSCQSYRVPLRLNDANEMNAYLEHGVIYRL